MLRLRDNGMDEGVAHLTIVKQGVAGAAAYANGEVIQSRSQSLSVVDTIGAGDAINAGFIIAWLESRTLQECQALGNACGAIAVSRRGGASDLPDLQYLLHE